MKIAYFSPLNPQKSGISDFSEELLPQLAKQMEVDLFVDGYEPTNPDIKKNFKIYNIDDIYKDEIRKQYDFLVYHMGNNADFHAKILKAYMDFPDILELHDVSLHNFMAAETVAKGKTEEYRELIEYCHGEIGKKMVKDFFDGLAPAPWEAHPLEVTMTKHIIEKARAIIVHSDFAKQMVKGIRSEVPVINIMLHTDCVEGDLDKYKDDCRKALNIDQDILILGSFGYASKPKRILEIIEALGILKKKYKKNFIYYIVGKVQGIDVESAVKEAGLEKNVVITGFTELDEFILYLGACDICLNLRYPTQGESSASLHRMLGMGKPVILTKIGSFMEYPDACSIKVRHDENEVKDIVDAIMGLATNKQKMKKMGMYAYAFAEENCSILKNAEKYRVAFEQIKEGTYVENTTDRFVDMLMGFGITDGGYIKHIASILNGVLQ